MSIAKFKINSVDYTDCVAQGGLGWARDDLHKDGSGRSLDGLMHVHRIAQKRVLKIQCRRLTDARAQQLVQFFLINVIGLGIRYVLFLTIDQPIINLAEKIVPADFFISPSVLGHNITMVIAVFIVMMWNFFANRLWTYNDVK